MLWPSTKIPIMRVDAFTIIVCNISIHIHIHILIHSPCGGCLLHLLQEEETGKGEGEEEGADLNPVYDGAADYEYNDMGNYDSIEVSTVGGRRMR